MSNERMTKREDDERMNEFEARLIEQSQSLNRHLEIYAQNGKEMQRMGDLIENQLLPRMKNVDELYELLTAGKTLRSTLKVVVIIILTTGSLIAAYGVIKGFIGTSVIAKQ